MKYQVVLFYKYTKIEDPESEMDYQINLLKKLNLSARMIVAEEGINGNFEGSPENTEEIHRNNE
ncbi:MAG: hypothetical protein Q9M91_05590 [Candidatus Dojkabacteria bacterium]|nr:hypothetical protein [Candidatus Dojkabacteria bacterium]